MSSEEGEDGEAAQMIPSFFLLEKLRDHARYRVRPADNLLMGSSAENGMYDAAEIRTLDAAGVRMHDPAEIRMHGAEILSHDPVEIRIQETARRKVHNPAEIRRLDTAEILMHDAAEIKNQDAVKKTNSGFCRNKNA